MKICLTVLNIKRILEQKISPTHVSVGVSVMLLIFEDYHRYKAYAKNIGSSISYGIMLSGVL